METAETARTTESAPTTQATEAPGAVAGAQGGGESPIEWEAIPTPSSGIAAPGVGVESDELGEDVSPATAASEMPVERGRQAAGEAPDPGARGASPSLQTERTNRPPENRAWRTLSQAHVRTVAMRPATVAALTVLGGAIVVAIVFVAAHGGLTLPATASPSSSVAVIASERASPLGATAEPSPSEPAAASSPTVAPPPGSPAASPGEATPAPPGGASPTYSPEELALLSLCPGQADCYQYRVRAGDSLHKIATLFGVGYDTLLALNPQITNPSVIHVGDTITLPPPGA